MLWPGLMRFMAVYSKNINIASATTLSVEIERDIDRAVETRSEKLSLFCIYRPLYIHLLSTKECLYLCGNVVSL